MSTVISDKIYTPEEFIKFLTGVEIDTISSPIIENLHKKMIELDIDELDINENESLCDYALSDIDEVIENNIPVLLVDVTEPNSEERVLRWFELPDDFSSDEDCKNSTWGDISFTMDDDDNIELFTTCQKCGYKYQFNFEKLMSDTFDPNKHYDPFEMISLLESIENKLELPKYCPECGIHMTEEEDCRPIGTWDPVEDDETSFTCSRCHALKSIDNNTGLPKYCDSCGDYKPKKFNVFTSSKGPSDIPVSPDNVIDDKNPLFGGCTGCLRSHIYCNMCRRYFVSYKEASKRRDMFHKII